MSDGRVVSLKDRRSEPGPVLSACLVFPNDLLRMPMEPSPPGPVWTTLEPVETQIDGRDAPVSVYPRFGMIDHSPDGTSGWVLAHEDGSISAHLYFERDLFVALQSAALSTAPLTLFVTFGARDGAPPTLMLAIERRTA